jgi:tetratricopeptide (TPR) repeat protein
MARTSLREALVKSEEPRESKPDGADVFPVLKANILAHLAIEEDTAAKRTEGWLGALGALDPDPKSDFIPMMPPSRSALYATIAVDFVQDSLCDASRRSRQGKLSRAKKLLDKSLDELLESVGEEDSSFGSLLAVKSSLLRFQSTGVESVQWVQKTSMLDEAIRCANRAFEITNNAYAQLALGLAHWWRARVENDPNTRAQKMAWAEMSLESSASVDGETHLLTLARFYREASRNGDSCNCFLRLMNSVSRISRRIRREAYVYGEAARFLHAQSPNDAETRQHVERAISLLSSAIDSGYRHARNVVALAHLRAINDGEVAGMAELRDLFPAGDSFDWNMVIEFVQSDDYGGHAPEAFALGLASSGVCTSLGTYAKDHCNDLDLAKKLYLAAINFNKADFIALTNLGRIYMETNDSGLLLEAIRLLGRAKGCAPLTFRWASDLHAEAIAKADRLGLVIGRRAKRRSQPGITPD